MADRVPPILQHDFATSAVIEPSSWFPQADVASHAVITWMPDVVASVVADYAAVEVHRFEAESAVHPVWQIEVGGRPVVVVLAGVGAPAATLLFEMLIAIGCRTFVACGSSGGLVPEIRPGTVIVPNGSLRDEGISYHYAPPAEIAPHDPGMQAAVQEACRHVGFDVTEGLTWTTDALFRETPVTVERRVERGCIAVEMEAAALASVAAFRGVGLGYAVYVADTVHGDEWDPTDLVQPDTAFRRRLFDSAVVACLQAGQAQST